MEILKFGENLLGLGLLVALAIFLSSVAGIAFRDRRLVRGVRVAFHGLLAVVGGSCACLCYGFVAGEYNCDYVYNYSEKLLPPFFKVAGLWAGLQGSLLLWGFLLCLFSSSVAFQYRWSSRHPTGRALEPFVYLVLSAVTLIFLLINWSESPFDTLDMPTRLLLAERHNVPLDDWGNLLDGGGLNQQLVNYWFVFHPPALYLGFVGWTVPFAFALAGLFTNQVGDYWIRIVRRWSLATWIFLTSGIILGGLWAYRQLGWGGYWAWDPVENASLLPWLTGTAFLHSIMTTRRRDMLKSWNVLLILLTFFLTIVGTWMTRSGVVSSVHAFAGGRIGLYFQIFLFGIAGVSAFMFALRLRSLAGTQGIDSVLSRETAFFVNNLILVIIATVVGLFSFYPKISHDWFGRTLSDHGWYNIVVPPFFAVLLLLTAVGPSLGWGKTSASSLRRSCWIPALATLVFTALLYGYFHWKGLLGTWSEVLVPRSQNQHPSALYPTGLFLALSFFVFATAIHELCRGVQQRVTSCGEGPVTAFFRYIVRGHRRYGGLAVHVGLAVLAAGITVSSMFKVKEETSLKIGQSAPVGPYIIEALDQRITDPKPGEPYVKDQVVFEVTRAAPAALPAAHGESSSARGTGAGGPAGGGEFVARIHPERRYYPKKRQWISEVSIHRRLFEDIYVYFSSRDAEGNIVLTVFLNPFMIFIYLGWCIMIGGALLAALPIPGTKAGPATGPSRAP